MNGPISNPILVTGGNGHIGYNILQCLLQHQYPIRATVRDIADDSKTSFLKHHGVEIFQANVLNFDELELAISGVQGIFHTAIPHLAWSADPENEIVRPYIEGTLNVLKLAKKYGVKRVVLISSCAAIGLDGKDQILEESQWNNDAVTILVQTKVKMEKLAWKFAKENDLNLVTLCPTYVIGPGFHRFTPTTQLYGDILLGKMPPIPEGGCHILDVRDLAEASRLIYESPTSQGRYIVAGPYFKISQLMNLLKSKFVNPENPKLKVPNYQIPVVLLYAICPLDWLNHKLTGKPRQLTSGLIKDFIGKFQRASIQKLENEIDWNPRSAEETIQDTFTWIKDRFPPPFTENSLWMANRNFDLLVFNFSGLACLFLLIPYLTHGDAVIFPIYNFYLLVFGIPHNYLTWATLFPKTSRKTFQMQPVFLATLLCLLIVLMIPLSEGTPLNNWVLSVVTYLSLWHSYRQHHGLCKIYDSIQAQRSKDFTIFRDRKWMNLFFAFGLNSVLAWAFTHPKVSYLLSADESYDLIYPVIPYKIYELYILATIVFGILAVKQSIWNRWKKGQFIPWPQISMMTVAILTYVVPYFFIPLSALPLAVAIGTIFHNIQYFGFVWLFEYHRSRELFSSGELLQIPQKLAFEGLWGKYFCLAFVYSLVVAFAFVAVPRQLGLVFIYFISLSHYVVDGIIWKKGNNALLSVVLGKMAQGR